MNNYLHLYTWIPNQVYYVKCVDKWGNYPGGSINANTCTAVNPFDIPVV